MNLLGTPSLFALAQLADPALAQSPIGSVAIAACMFGAVASMFCALACLLCMRVVLRRTLELQRQLNTEAKPEPEPEVHPPRPRPRRRAPMPPPFDLYEATELLPMPTEQVDVRALLRASKA